MSHGWTVLRNRKHETPEVWITFMNRDLPRVSRFETRRKASNNVRQQANSALQSDSSNITASLHISVIMRLYQ